jgi:hypothetical protein
MHDFLLRAARLAATAGWVTSLGCGGGGTAATGTPDGSTTTSGPAAPAGSEAGGAAVDDGGVEAAVVASPCPGIPIIPDGTGYVGPGSNSAGVVGAWYAYYDCNDYTYFNLGVPMPGINCSNVAAPTPGGPFLPTAGPAPTPARMCTNGTTVPAVTEAGAEWQTHWGAGIGLDLDNPSGAKLDFNALDAGGAPIKGFCIALSGATIPPLHVNLPTDQNITDNWYFEIVSTAGAHQILFDDPGLQELTATATPFDPSKLQSIQLLIPASPTLAVPWDFCVDQLTVLQ